MGREAMILYKTAKLSYKTVNFYLVDEIDGEDVELVGVCIPDQNTILVKKQKPADEYWTELHEKLHMISDQFDLGLTESDVLTIEHSLRQMHESEELKG
jgi:hypothetical protein